MSAMEEAMGAANAEMRSDTIALATFRTVHAAQIAANAARVAYTAMTVPVDGLLPVPDGIAVHLLGMVQGAAWNVALHDLMTRHAGEE